MKKKVVVVMLLMLLGLMLKNYTEQKRQYNQNRALAQEIARAMEVQNGQ
jgi:uncharacterized protein YejL (UPF0352 family)